MRTYRIGVIGCGNISPAYLKNLSSFEATDVVALADLDLARAKERAGEFGVPRACSVEELLADPSVEVILNLTVPKAHFEVAMAALEAGKHVYNEKPLTVTVEDGKKLMHFADSKGLRVGCAPDTVLGAGVQKCRNLVDEGAIGAVVGANAFMMCPGHESWHPSPEFYYEVGGGPMLDMGPYYASALFTLLGAVRRVQGSTRITSPTRTITSQPKHGKVVEVETATHIVGLLDFANGCIGQITTSFDVRAHTMPCIEIYGTKGSLRVPDPNGFGGEVLLNTNGEWESQPLEHAFSENARGLGILDMVYAIENGRPHRASGAMALHVLEIMHGVENASRSGCAVELDASLPRPEPMSRDNTARALAG